MKKVTAKSYTLKNDDGSWLGQVVLTNDGMFSGVTDWGNFAYAWRHYGTDRDFDGFILALNVDYFAEKMMSAMSYSVSGMNKKIEASCYRFAKRVLPALQARLKEEKTKQETRCECEIHDVVYYGCRCQK